MEPFPPIKGYMTIIRILSQKNIIILLWQSRVEIVRTYILFISYHVEPFFATTYLRTSQNVQMWCIVPHMLYQQQVYVVHRFDQPTVYSKVQTIESIS